MIMELDSIVKISQIIFYLGGLSIGVLTYQRARSTILNTVNTEYHKKVLDRLAELSEELYREFDFSSDEAWHKQDDVGYVVQMLHDQIVECKEEIITSGEIDSGIPLSPKHLQLMNLINRYKSDPFLPEAIRNQVVSLLEKRSNAMFSVYETVINKYKADLAKGKHWDTLETNKHWIHNKVIDRLRKEGVGISEVEDAVHNIRLEIQ